MSYPVLAPVSEGYPKDWGRLLTCYSPVRRSSTPERAFPLDLHVLSTPPAFVLSQDQTLHRKTNPHTQPKIRRREKKSHSPDKTITHEKHSPESSSKKPRPTTPTTHPKGKPQKQSTSGQNKLIRRLSNTLLSSQESDAPASGSVESPVARSNCLVQ